MEQLFFAKCKNTKLDNPCRKRDGKCVSAVGRMLGRRAGVLVFPAEAVPYAFDCLDALGIPTKFVADF